MTTSESERAASAWEPTTRNHDPQHLAFARECYAAGFEAGATDLARLWDIARLRAEVAHLRADVERHESYGGELEGRLADRSEEVARLTRERDAWSDEAVKMLRQRNVVLGWARERAGFAHVHDVMVAAGLAAAPAADPETLDRPGSEIDEDDTHRGPSS